MSEDKQGALCYRFGEFVLDVPDRQLWHAGARVDLSARYLDALVLLVEARGQLVEKSRFFEEVWADVVVSDSALTQCIKEVRKKLGDDASAPRYIQTVPRHGYRFIATAEPVAASALQPGLPRQAENEKTPQGGQGNEAGYHGLRRAWQHGLYEWGAGTLGGGFAGLLGGLLYGFGLASAEVGALSTLLVLVSLNVLVGLAGGSGVGLGLAGGGVVARVWPGGRALLRVGGAALGGLFVGALAKLLGVDAFDLLFGRAPAGITGGPEGAILGAALAMGAHLGGGLESRFGSAARWWPPVAGAGVAGAVAGALIPLAGGHLMGGSLDLLVRSFAESRLQLDQFGVWFGELRFGLATQVTLGGGEGLLFGSCVVGALALMNHLRDRRASPWRL